MKKDKSLFGLPLRTLDGQETTLAPYRGQVLLIVNTASDCGYTPQYAGLQKLYDRYRERGFVVLGFPSDDFKKEPAPEADIRQFVTETFGLTFPMFAKTHVIGEDRAPLYTRLAKHDPDPERREIHWNFTKYLLSRRGRVITRFEPQVDPLSDEVVKAVEKALAD
ncbi:MAG: redoxin domain-containing protein [Myxococcales bacterium]|nr:redoxin domain-containing protein [Myxococcales bacterium]MCB9732062.1 redoxin domain-containing protein [Deltaproteobacteria bacterium]